MPVPERSVPVGVLRDAAREAVRTSGLRRTAREIGLSSMGLSSFLKGARPQSATVAKLTAWYVRTASERAERPTAGTARAALGILMNYLPSKQRTEAVREVRAVLERQSKAGGVPLPEWVEDLEKE